MNDWLSLTALSRDLPFPEPTIRRYAKIFSDYLPHRKIGRMTLYAPDTGVVLTRISHLSSQGRKKDEIIHILNNEFPRTIDIDSCSVREKTTMVQNDPSGELQEKLFQFLEIVSDQSKKIEALMERDNQTAANLARLTQQLEEERAHRHALENISSRYNQALRKLYHAHKEHHAMILELRAAPLEENNAPHLATERINERMNQLEDIFLDDMEKLQQLMHQVLHNTAGTT